MARICVNCGREIVDGAAFCTECGTPAPAVVEEVAEAIVEEVKAAVEPAPEPAPAPAPEEPAPAPEKPAPAPEKPAPAVAPAAPVAPVAPEKPKTAAPAPKTPAVKPAKDGTVGTGYFFWMALVFAIPVVGWIICIITSLASKNPSKKNYAKALIIWFIVGLVILALAALAVLIFKNTIFNVIGNTLGVEITSFSDLFNLF